MQHVVDGGEYIIYDWGFATDPRTHQKNLDSIYLNVIQQLLDTIEDYSRWQFGVDVLSYSECVGDREVVRGGKRIVTAVHPQMKYLIP